MNKQKIEQLTEDLIKVSNKYIDEDNMSTEDVCACFMGAAILVVRASKPFEIKPTESGKSIVEDNLEVN